MGRRWLRVSDDLIVAMCKNKPDHAWRLTEHPLPDDARIVERRLHPGQICLLLESAAWPDTPPHETAHSVSPEPWFETVEIGPAQPGECVPKEVMDRLFAKAAPAPCEPVPEPTAADADGWTEDIRLDLPGRWFRRQGWYCWDSASRVSETEWWLTPPGGVAIGPFAARDEAFAHVERCIAGQQTAVEEVKPATPVDFRAEILASTDPVAAGWAEWGTPGSPLHHFRLCHDGGGGAWQCYFVQSPDGSAEWWLQPSDYALDRIGPFATWQEAFAHAKRCADGKQTAVEEVKARQAGIAIYSNTFHVAGETTAEVKARQAEFTNMDEARRRHHRELADLAASIGAEQTAVPEVKPEPKEETWRDRAIRDPVF